MSSITGTDLILEHVTRHSYDEIFIVGRDGDVIMASPSFKSLFGVNAREIVGENVYELEAKNILTPSFTGKVLQTKEKQTHIQETALGRKIVVSAYPIIDGNGDLAGAISFSRDITELEFLRKTNEQIDSTIKLYEKEIARMKGLRGAAFPLGEKMKKVMDVVEKVSDLDVPVLLEGESGVGKNYVAHMIHEKSGRAGEPFIEVNCGAIPENLIESELFGYEEGAFTGAKKGGKGGYFEAAKEGTLFLDEIAELPLNLQVKLLSVLQNYRIQRVGGQGTIDIKCRIICATNQHIEELVEEKKFREDLYYRINVIKIYIPPLRERREEIVPLATELVRELNEKYQMDKHFSAGMLSWLKRQEWSGNIRELRNFIERTLITANEDIIDMEEMELTGYPEEDLTLDQYMEMVEGEFIRRMYKKYPSSTKLAEKLGISQSKANRRINQYVSRT